MTNSTFITIFIMSRSRGEARRISDILLKKRLIACANVVPGVESKFWWQGKIDSAKEVLLILKTVKRNFRKIEKEVRRLHSYDVPEIIALPIQAGSQPYFNWITSSVKR